MSVFVSSWTILSTAGGTHLKPSANMEQTKDPQLALIDSQLAPRRCSGHVMKTQEASTFLIVTVATKSKTQTRTYDLMLFIFSV